MQLLKLLIPNILSGSRLLAALVFPFSPDSIWIWLIVIAGISDALDGWLARKWKVITWQGGLIDAVADKLFVLSVLIVFVNAGKIELWWIPAVISRDLLVLFTAVYIAVKRLWKSFTEMPARVFGKIATGGQFVLFLAVATMPSSTFYALLFASLCSGIAAVDYAWLFAKALVFQHKYR